MARIIETIDGNRRLIQMTANDIISIVNEYQRIVPRGINYEMVRNYLENTVIYLPEDL